MRVLIGIILSILLCSCSSQKECRVELQPQRVDQIASKPPEAAMKPPSKAIPLKVGAEDSYNSGVMRVNNLSCSNDRAKLIILQDYIRTLFPEVK